MSSLPSTLPDGLPAAGLAATRRALRPLIGPVVNGLGNQPPLEQQAMRSEPAVVASCVPLEAPAPRRVTEASQPLVAAFLDGVQRSRVIGHVAGTPLVYATVAAAIRQRAERRPGTWQRPLQRALVLASRTALGPEWWERLQRDGVLLANIDQPADSRADALGEPAGSGEIVPWHPHAARARALALVALEREQLERQLAARWCAGETRWLWIDGGVAGNVAFDERTPVFGVVKSHNTLYGDQDAVTRVLALREGERSPAFLVGHTVRRAVASWYLRWRAPANGDPLFGLIRVEVVPPAVLLDDPRNAPARDAFTRHCDRLSAAILLERRPVSLPDARWHTLAYGVHEVESYLNALIGP